MGITVTLSQFRSEQSHYLDAAQREPVTILSRGPRRRAVVVSPDFYDRAVQALSPTRSSRPTSNWTDLPVHTCATVFDHR